MRIYAGMRPPPPSLFSVYGRLCVSMARCVASECCITTRPPLYASPQTLRQDYIEASIHISLTSLLACYTLTSTFENATSEFPALQDAETALCHTWTPKTSYSAGNHLGWCPKAGVGLPPF